MRTHFFDGSRFRLNPTAVALTGCLAASLTLAGCNSIRKDTQAGLEGTQAKSAEARARLDAAINGKIVHEKRPWYGKTIVAKSAPAARGKKLPKQFESARGFALKLPGQADVKSIAAAITGGTDIPVNIRTRYILPNGNSVRVPIGTKMAVNTYEGSLSAFLERMASRMDIAWQFDGTTITIDRMVNRDYRIALANGQTEYTSTATGLGATNVATRRTIDTWQDLEDRLKPLAPSPARITLSREAGRVSVFGPPSVQIAAKRVIDEVATTAATRIGLEVAVYFVDSDRVDAFSSGLGISHVVGSGPTLAVGTTAGQTFSGEQLSGSIGISSGLNRLDFRALAKDRAVADYRLGSSIAQSGVVAPIKVSRSVNYIRSIETTQPTTTNGQPTTSTTTDTVETGISIIALPRLIDPATIQLSLTLVQRDLIEIVAGTGSSVELPITEQREISSETVLAPGETLVLSGYEIDVSRAEERGLGVLRRIGLGGVNGRKRQRVSLIVLVRPTIVPRRGR